MNFFLFYILIIIMFTIIFLVTLLDLILIPLNKSIHRFIQYPLYKKSILTIQDIQSSNEFKRSVQKGYKNVKSKSIVICCLCRNIKHVFLHNKKKLEHIGRLFKKYKIILFENDSSDNSRMILKSWEKINKNVTLLKCSL